MSKALFDLTALRPALTEQHTIITPNRRMAAKIHAAYAQEKVAMGLHAWPTPRVMALEAWLQSQWARLADLGYRPALTRTLLTEFQSQLMWEQILRQDDDASALLRVTSTAHTAHNAFKQLVLWQVALDDNELATTSEGVMLQRWSVKFLAQCQQQHLLPIVQLAEVLTKAWHQQWLTKLSDIWLVGFDSLAPLYQALFQVAADAVHDIRPTCESETKALACLPRFHDELRVAAQWAKSVLAENQEAMIGIIVPTLSQCRDQVERIFQQVFEPQYMLADTARYTLPFNFSAGTPLSQQPIVVAALMMLQLNRPQLSTSVWQALFNTPFWRVSLYEEGFLAYFLRELADLQQEQLSTSLVRYRSQASYSRWHQLQQLNPQGDLLAEPTCYLTQQLQRFEQLKIEHQGGFQVHKQWPSHWAKLFAKQLALLGWPGEQRLDSVEYQQVTRFYEALKSFAGLDGFTETLSLPEALALLQRQLLQNTFQAQTKDSPIQILGALEGAGLRFSHCWLVGFDDSHWPPAPAPNPLIPIALQVRLHMPHASAERELMFTQSLISGYQHNAQHVVFSYAKHEGEREQAPCPLLNDLPTLDVNRWLKPINDYTETLLAQHHLERWRVDHSAGVAQPSQVRGGSRILQNQALCPFKAFAEHRLRVNPWPQVVFGITPQDRGQYLHQALAFCWQQLGKRQELIALTEAQEAQLIDAAIAEALEQFRKRQPQLLTPRLYKMEQQRLKETLFQWLALEKARPDFEVVVIERRRRCEFAGLPLQLQVDRIDRLADGTLLLVDYKSSASQLQSWLGERPDNPQLPLYVLQAKQPITALAFAEVRRGLCQWQGLAATEVGIEGIDPLTAKKRRIALPAQWDELIKQWQTNLTDLVKGFLQGDTRVEPKRPQVCQQCQRQSLCRVQELSL
ncbi:PD-(D/E)XK nuclease family protein [Zooshikella ganghwensis]|uniref:PD-(D/E)XK nuclease family protein n=1 Tax=Zooshikella ganghwensis TaxID=202772 RepID=UPI0004259EB4|nr:PD-(D/E)XK nuclease family protein [Zooshikella ganghwensis]